MELLGERGKIIAYQEGRKNGRCVSKGSESHVCCFEVGYWRRDVMGDQVERYDHSDAAELSCDTIEEWTITVNIMFMEIACCLSNLETNGEVE